MRYLFALLILLLTPVGAAQAQGTWEERSVERLAWPELQTFQSERDFRNWVRDVRRMQRRFRNNRADAGLTEEIIVAQVDVELGDCNPLLQNCFPAEDDGNDRIIVTGSRIASAPAAATPVSITNNQTANVDEGDIVKRIGDYLLVLQDGQIFAANFRTMQLTDRIEVFRRDEDGDPIGADWYDEMLVEGDHILITAYSYTDDASEISVFRLDQVNGRVERRGVFLISSEDYYDIDNYATRVVGDRLIIYTPYEPEDMVDRRDRPVVRRWVPGEEFDDRERDGDPILSAENIYRPVFGTYDPIVHTISICDLGDLDDDRLECESTGFIAAEYAEMFVSPTNIYLATTAANSRDSSRWAICRAVRAGWQVPEAAPGAVFRLPLRRRDEVDLLSVRGLVFDQFSMDEVDNQFRAVLTWPSASCGETWREDENLGAPMSLVNQSIGSFRTEYRDAPDRRFTELPRPPAGHVENRFIGDWLLYGSRSRWGRPPMIDEDDEQYLPGYANAVRVSQPEVVERLELGHEITRLESLGGDAVSTGYRDQSGLYISYIDLGDTAAIAGQVHLKGHYESENRSHAFNSMTYPDRDGLLGLPTVRATGESSRYPWRSNESQLSFLRFDAEGELSDLGAVEPSPFDPDQLEEGYANGHEWIQHPNGYRCEVSCVDWYGNSRPIFIDRGVYALMGTELVEARALDDSVEVLRRLDLTGALPE